MSFETNERANGNLTVAAEGTMCSEDNCGSKNGKRGTAVHHWCGHNYCGYHSPFDVSAEDVEILDFRTRISSIISITDVIEITGCRNIIIWLDNAGDTMLSFPTGTKMLSVVLKLCAAGIISEFGMRTNFCLRVKRL